jgi:hypothetical protein
MRFTKPSDCGTVNDMRPALAVCVTLLVSTPALAQQAGQLGQGFVAAGVLTASDDSADRVRFPDGPVTGSRWFAEGAVFVGRGIGLGIETVPLGTVSGSYDAACCILRDDEREKAIFGAVRWRALHLRRIALDPLVAFGRVAQHRETQTSLRFVPASTTTNITDTDFPAWGFGVDVPVAIVPHFAVVPLFRRYVLQRESQDTANVTASPSVRFVVGLLAGLSW